MKLSAPIFQLKKQAKEIKRSKNISFATALDIVAKREGFSSWSLLMAKREDLFPRKYSEMLEYFYPGDMVMVASRPSFGKTSFCVGIFTGAIKSGGPKSFYFTLAESHKKLASRIATYDHLIGGNESAFSLNYSNDICADYIISAVEKEIEPGAKIFVDYLQLLDEKRVNPPLQQQIEKLRNYAIDKKCAMILFLSLIGPLKIEPVDVQLKVMFAIQTTWI